MKEEKIHKELNHLDDFKEFDVEQEWTSFLEKATNGDDEIILNVDETNTKSAQVRRLPRLGLSIAASLILIIGCMYFFNLKSETNIDPILVETPVEKIEVIEPEPVTPEPEIVEKVNPKEVVVPKANPIPKEKVDPAELITLDNKPLAVADSPKPNAPATEYEKYEIGELINLSDGSTVEILDLAIMNIPESFDGASTRNIKIKSGNAEFTVTKSETQPFSVTTSNSEVSVLGTTFRLLSEGLETTVKTVEGIVEFYTLDNPEEKYTVNAGEEFMFDGSMILNVSESIEEESEPKMNQNSLEGLKNLLKINFPDNVKVDDNAVKKSDANKLVNIPTEYEDFLKVIELLEEQVTIKYKEGKCDSCYIIESIKIKDDK